MLGEARIEKGEIIAEATSGNTGVALAALGAVLGFRVILFVPETASEEKVTLMRLYGAEIMRSGKNTDEAYRHLQNFLKENPHIKTLDQFRNEANTKGHLSMAEEIYNAIGIPNQIFVPLGTGGTATALGSFFRSKGTEIVGVFPLGEIPGMRHFHKSFTPPVYREESVDRVVEISRNEAILGVLKLARKEGIAVGISSGAAFSAARRYGRGRRVVIAPDGAETYLSILKEVVV